MPDLPQKKVGIVACSGEELAEGTVTDGRLVLETTAVLGTPTAKEVSALRRTVEGQGVRPRDRVSRDVLGLAA